MREECGIRKPERDGARRGRKIFHQKNTCDRISHPPPRKLDIGRPEWLGKWGNLITLILIFKLKCNYEKRRIIW